MDVRVSPVLDQVKIRQFLTNSKQQNNPYLVSRSTKNLLYGGSQKHHKSISVNKKLVAINEKLY
jgi:hypothetical protein